MIKLPKIELHCHLDGSIRPQTIIDIAKKENISIASHNVEEIKELVTVKEDCTSLNEYLEKFDLANKVMQSKYGLKRVTYELLEDAYKENVKYIELRFAPLLHVQNGLSINEIIQSVVDGINDAEKDYDIKGNIILSCMRSMSVEDGLKVVKAGSEFINNKVVGIDLAGCEEEGFCFKFKRVIDEARKCGYNVTIHAGEAASAQNVIDAINILGARRIGHGVRINDMKEAYDLVKSSKVYLEMCPTSNIQTKAINDFNNYPFYEFYKDGLYVTLNTDNRTVSDINLTNEIDIIFNNFDISYTDYKKIYLNTVDATFADDKTKQWLRSLI